MKSVVKLLAIAPLVLGATLSANATTLDITGTADNEFAVYLATGSNASLGTPIGLNPAGADWHQSFVLPSTTLSGTPLYLQVVLTNWTTANGFSYGFSATSNPYAFLADLSISDPGYVFANGSQTISTNTVNWLGSTTGAPGTWVQPVGSVTSAGANSDPTTIWYTNNGNNKVLGIGDSAQWIFSGNQSTALYADLSVEINATSSTDLTTPLPAALPLFATGLGAMGLFGWRRKRKNAAAVAAA